MGEIQGESPEKIEGEETMSMTQEEAIVNLEKLIALFHVASEQRKMVDYSKIIETLEFAAAALRPVSRERVEQVWRGCSWCNNGADEARPAWNTRAPILSAEELEMLDERSL